jgi:hypothetical protein
VALITGIILAGAALAFVTFMNMNEPALVGSDPTSVPTLVSTVLPSASPSSMGKVSCKIRGGRWEPLGLLGPEGCILPTSDGGKECVDSSQCETFCIAPSNISSSATNVVGECYGWYRRSLTVCSPRVEGGAIKIVPCE